MPRIVLSTCEMGRSAEQAEQLRPPVAGAAMGSKVEVGQVELQVAPFSLQDTLERGVSTVRERATTDGDRSVDAPHEGDVVGEESPRLQGELLL